MWQNNKNVKNVHYILRNPCNLTSLYVRFVPLNKNQVNLPEREKTSTFSSNPCRRLQTR